MQWAAARHGLSVRRRATAHAGGKWTLQYTSARGQLDSLEVDLNFQLWVPLWPVVMRASRPLGSHAGVTLPLLDEHELLAGKLAALLARRASRDLFDAHWLLTRHLATGVIDTERLRLAFVVYGAMSATDWRTVTPAQVDFDRRELHQELLPVLQHVQVADAKRDRGWGERLAHETREALAVVLPLRPAEAAFLAAVRDEGTVRAELLTSDPDVQSRIAVQPQLQWRAAARLRRADPDDVRRHEDDLPPD